MYVGTVFLGILLSRLPKITPPRHLNISVPHREMNYYCTLTAAFTLIMILTILADLCLFLIISRHESVILSNCRYEVSSVVPWPPLGCIYIIQTRHHFEFAFIFITFMTQREISILSRFFLLPIFLRIMSHSPGGLVAFPNTPPIFYSQCLNFTCLVVLVVYVPF